MKHVWLVLRSGYEEDMPLRALPTKASAKKWVKKQDPALLFRYEDAELVVASPRGKDWVAQYLVQRIPFGDDQ
ncbi:hypothetical protein [Nocardia sp. NPDC059239]|uniref:hypothetical protein n=1 Tax=unclassified Nocardia TaxID=2637762 RepID=UPI0036AC781E